MSPWKSGSEENKNRTITLEAVLYNAKQCSPKSKLRYILAVSGEVSRDTGKLITCHRCHQYYWTCHQYYWILALF